MRKPFGRLHGSESGKLGHAVHELLAIWDCETRLSEKLEEGDEMIACQETQTQIVGQSVRFHIANEVLAEATDGFEGFIQEQHVFQVFADHFADF